MDSILSILSILSGNLISRNTTFIVVLAGLFLAGCASPHRPLPPLTPLPTSIPITDAAGTPVASQPGLLWVLLSGVDEHGLIAEHDLLLLTTPNPTAFGPLVHTGVAAAVHEIRQTGPQSLQRFYRVQTVTGVVGWISDYYVRRLAYLYNERGETVTLYDAPDGRKLTELINVSPVTLQDPTRPDWWLVQAEGGGPAGWVEVRYVKESPEREFLLNQQHEHR